MTKAPVNKIIDSSLVDGPGNRTSVFLQGCNYHCTYCHNPETIRLCTHCGECVEKCPVGALSLTGGRVVWRPDLCVACDTCIKVCRHMASPRVRLMSSGEVLEHIRANMPFIAGITTSGGECTLYRDFLIELFEGAHELGLTCLIDSNGSCNFGEDRRLLDAADGVMLDVKSTDADEYRAITGADGSRVLAIARRLASLGKLTEVRTVCSPDYNSEKTVRDVCAAAAEYQDRGDIHYRLIRYRRFGVREPYRTEITPPDDTFMRGLYDVATGLGMTHVSVV